MTTSLTFQGAGHPHRRFFRWPAVVAVALIAVAAPTVACEKPTRALIAGAQGAPQNEATFTGRFVDGAPVYRLPAITVVSRRPAEVARTQRVDAPTHPAPAARSRAKAPVPAGKVASASRAADAIEPCIG